MEIGFAIILYMLASGVFVLALCAAAARPMPRPEAIEPDGHGASEQF